MNSLQHLMFFCACLMSAFTLSAQNDSETKLKNNIIQNADYYNSQVKKPVTPESESIFKYKPLVTPYSPPKQVPQSFASEDECTITRNGLIDKNGQKHFILIKEPNVEGMAKMPIKKVED